MNTPQKERVKILNATYDVASDTIAWQVKLKNGQEADMVWLRQDYAQTFGISGLMPIPIVKESCEKMIGKEVNVQIEPKPHV